jgi:hypothetical protein
MDFVTYIVVEGHQMLDFYRMMLFDLIAHCRTPFVVQDGRTHRIHNLNGASAFADRVRTCPTRYVLTDDLTRLCTALAYSKGARTLACADLLRIPAEILWIEWCESPYLSELSRYGFPVGGECSRVSGRRGALVRASSDGRRGSLQTFWSIGPSDSDVLAGCMESYFDLDATAAAEPAPPDGIVRPTIRVTDKTGTSDIIGGCFRFRFEETWDRYYASGNLSRAQWEAVAHRTLGSIAPAIPVLLAFFLLLGTTSSLPKRSIRLDKLNRTRAQAGQHPLLDHVEVHSPIWPDAESQSTVDTSGGRRSPRLHHVRGHLVRRDAQLFWRVPHLRGSASAGIIRTRTVTWTINTTAASHFGAGAAKVAPNQVDARH